MHKGDIILNHWASAENPVRISIITHIGKEYTQCLYESNGNLIKSRLYTHELKRDREHFEIIGHLDFEKPIKDMLKALKERE
jgi:hypothetical protein